MHPVLGGACLNAATLSATKPYTVRCHGRVLQLGDFLLDLLGLGIELFLSEAKPYPGLEPLQNPLSLSPFTIPSPCSAEEPWACHPPAPHCTRRKRHLGLSSGLRLLAQT